jgi:hypothetical protein
MDEVTEILGASADGIIAICGEQFLRLAQTHVSLVRSSDDVHT